MESGAEQMFGYTEDETMGRFLYDFIPVSKRNLVGCKKTQLITCSHLNNRGQEIQCDIFYSPIMNFQGKKLGIAVLAKDISGRVKDKADLKHQERYLADIFGFAPIGIYHVDMEGKVTSANPEYAWMTGYESAEAAIDQITDFVTQVFYDPKRAEDFMFAMFEAEEVVRFRCRIKRKDNSFYGHFAMQRRHEMNPVV